MKSDANKKTVEHIKEQNKDKVFIDFFEKRRKQTMNNRKKAYNKYTNVTLDERNKKI